MTADEYVPSDGDLYEQIAKRRYEYDYTSPWEHLAPAPRKLLTLAARNTMEPIIARVRCDAVQQFIEACKAKRDEPGFLLPPNHWQDIEAAIRVAESYVKNHPEGDDQ